jgi:hypothetical protein
MNALRALRVTALSTAAAASLAAAPAAAAVTASATPGPLAEQTLASIKTHAATAIADREATLQGLASAVEATAQLSASDRAALLALIGGDESGLTALGQTIAADTTVRAAWQDAQKIVHDYRVYVLVVPQTDLVRAADLITSVSGTLAGLEPTLSGLIAQAALNPGQHATALEALSDFGSKVGAARSDVSAVSAELLALTPAGYPGNAGQVTAAHAAVAGARTELRDARQDVTTILGIVHRAH